MFTRIACDAAPPMHAYESAAETACPLLSLSREKFIHSLIAYELQVFQHTHSILCPIALVQLLDPPAGLLTRAAVSPAVFQSDTAALDDAATTVLRRYIVAAAAAALILVPLIRIA